MYQKVAISSLCIVTLILISFGCSKSTTSTTREIDFTHTFGLTLPLSVNEAMMNLSEIFDHQALIGHDHAVVVPPIDVTITGNDFGTEGDSAKIRIVSSGYNAAAGNYVVRLSFDSYPTRDMPIGESQEHSTVISGRVFGTMSFFCQFDTITNKPEIAMMSLENLRIVGDEHLLSVTGYRIGTDDQLANSDFYIEVDRGDPIKCGPFSWGYLVGPPEHIQYSFGI